MASNPEEGNGLMGDNPIEPEERMKSNEPSDAGNPSAKNKWLKLLAIGVVVIIVAAIVVGLVFGLKGGLVECDDDYQGVAYTSKDGEEKFVKFKVAMKGDDDDAYSWEEAKDVCLQEGARLWEVDSGEEWNAIMSQTDSIDIASLGLWLNLEVIGQCESGRSAECNLDKASVGEGLKVRLPTSGRIADYSRMVGGPDALCIFIPEKSGSMTRNADRIWRRAECQGSLYLRFCVKRQCKKPGSE